MDANDSSKPARRKRGGQAGNLNALKHGFYSAQFRSRENHDLDTALATGLQGEIDMMRVMTRRVMELADGVESLDTAMDLLGVLGMSAIRLASLLKAQKLLGRPGDQDMATALSEALTDVVKELGIKKD